MNFVCVGILLTSLIFVLEGQKKSYIKKDKYDINECTSSPCQNGGTCNDQVNGYTCSCVAGYTGELCETGLGYEIIYEDKEPEDEQEQPSDLSGQNAESGKVGESDSGGDNLEFLEKELLTLKMPDEYPGTTGRTNHPTERTIYPKKKTIYQKPRTIHLTPRTIPLTPRTIPLTPRTIPLTPRSIHPTPKTTTPPPTPPLHNLHCTEKPEDRGKCDCCPPPCCCICKSGNCMSSNLDLVLILDASGSISVTEWNSLRNWLVSFVEKLNGIGPDQRVAVVKFATTAKVEWNLAHECAQDRNKLINKLKILPKSGTGGSTNVPEALKVTATQVFNGPGDSPARANVAIVFTDGVTSMSNLLTQYANNLQNVPAKVIAVGIGDNISLAQLKIIASDPDSTNVLESPDFDKLKDILDALLGAICSQEECYCCCPPPWKLWKQMWY